MQKKNKQVLSLLKEQWVLFEGMVRDHRALRKNIQTRRHQHLTLDSLDQFVALIDVRCLNSLWACVQIGTFPRFHPSSSEPHTHTLLSHRRDLSGMTQTNTHTKKIKCVISAGARYFKTHETSVCPGVKMLLKSGKIFHRGSFSVFSFFY